MEELRRILLHEVIGIYGPKYGQGIGTVIIPAFLGDFKTVLEKSDSMDVVNEEYMTEDKKIHLILSGRRIMGAKGIDYEITGCNFNDREVLEVPGSERILL
jgi:hypothetical protein